MIAIDCAFLLSSTSLYDSQVGDKAPDFTLKSAVSCRALDQMLLFHARRSMAARSRLAAHHAS